MTDMSMEFLLELLMQAVHVEMHYHKQNLILWWWMILKNYTPRDFWQPTSRSLMGADVATAGKEYYIFLLRSTHYWA